MLKRLSSVLFAAATALILGCATSSTTLDAQWVNPEYIGKRPIRSMMVMAAVRDSTNRRISEDRMVAALSAAGVKAVQSYTLLPTDVIADRFQ